MPAGNLCTGGIVKKDWLSGKREQQLNLFFEGVLKKGIPTKRPFSSPLFKREEGGILLIRAL
jgi:hypothetical protein